MIVREILNHPSYAFRFDFFNDYKDTVIWLEGVKTEKSEAALATLRLAKESKDKAEKLAREGYRQISRRLRIVGKDGDQVKLTIAEFHFFSKR